MRRFSSFSGTVVFITVLIFTLFIGCRKTEQKNVEPETIGKAETKSFFFVPPGTEDIIHSIAQKIYRQNQQKPFAEDLLKSVGYPIWNHSLVADGPGSTRAVAQKGNIMNKNGQRVILYIPFAKESERKTKAVLRIIIDGSDTAFRMLYPQHYQNYGFDENSTQMQAPVKLTTSVRFKLTMSGRFKLTTTGRSKLTTV